MSHPNASAHKQGAGDLDTHRLPSIETASPSSLPQQGGQLFLVAFEQALVVLVSPVTLIGK